MPSLSRRLTWWWTALAGVAFAVLAGLVASGATAGFDRALQAPALDPRGWPGQIWATIAIVAHPYVVIVAGLALALWVGRQHLLRLSVAIAAAIVGGPLLQLGLKLIFARARPETTMSWVIGSDGYAFPSGHATAITIFAVLAVRTRLVLRQGTARVWLARVTGLAAIVIVALDRWALSVHWVTDLVGGVLFGCFIAGLALSLVSRAVRSPKNSTPGTGVAALSSVIDATTSTPSSALPHQPQTPPSVSPTLRRRTLADRPVRPSAGAVAAAETRRRAAIVYNPTKVGSVDLFRRQIAATLAEHDWADPLWYETTPDHAGRSQARAALGLGVNLVIAAGGDGTITAVGQALAHSGVPLAILPSGTANLLARNVRLPLDEPAALTVALTGTPQAVDLVKITTDDFEGYSASISGIGLDAQIMADTTNDAKRFWGNAAYAWSILGNLNGEPHDFHLTLDDGPAIDRHAVFTLIGNTSLLQVPVTLFPQASYDDGVFDILVATPQNFGDWTVIGTKLLAGKPSDLDPATAQPDGPLEYAQARRLVITTDRPVTFEVDGDPIGATSRLVAEIQPKALLVMGPGAIGV